MCVCVCVCVCECVSGVFVFAFTCLCLCLCLYVSVSLPVFVCVCVSVSVCLCLCPCLCLCLCGLVCACILCRLLKTQIAAIQAGELDDTITTSLAPELPPELAQPLLASIPALSQLFEAAEKRQRAFAAGAPLSLSLLGCGCA